MESDVPLFIEQRPRAHMTAHGRIPSSSGATPAATSQLQLKATPAIRAATASPSSNLRFRLKPVLLHSSGDCERLTGVTIQFPWRRRLLPSLGSSERSASGLHAHAVVRVRAEPRTGAKMQWISKRDTGTRVYHRSSRGPSLAPASVQRTIVPPYQIAMKGRESAMQCSA